MAQGEPAAIVQELLDEINPPNRVNAFDHDRTDSGTLFPESKYEERAATFEMVVRWAAYGSQVSH